MKVASCPKTRKRNNYKSLDMSHEEQGRTNTFIFILIGSESILYAYADAVRHKFCKLMKPRGLCKTLVYGISIN